MPLVKSKDGTTIAFEQSGRGPAVVLVGAALADRTGTAKLARLLAATFTVVNYDRRGRGDSTDTPPFAIEREVEDIEALIDAAGGSAYVFGSSSGAALAIEAAGRIGDKVRGVFVYEPPFIVDDSHPAMPQDLAARIDHLVAAGRRNDAVRLFFEKGMGIPSVFVIMMRWLMPGWSKMAGMAHTLAYDLAVLEGTQAGRPLPAGRWSAATAPTLVMVGAKSEPFFHAGARALTERLPRARYGSLPGGHHGSVMMSPKNLAAAVTGFFRELESHGGSSREPSPSRSIAGG